MRVNTFINNGVWQRNGNFTGNERSYGWIWFQCKSNQIIGHARKKYPDTRDMDMYDLQDLKVIATTNDGDMTSYAFKTKAGMTYKSRCGYLGKQ